MENMVNANNVCNIWSIIPEYISAIGTFLIGIGAIAVIPRVKNFVSAREEILYGDDAKNRYELIKDTLPTKYPYIWGPNEWSNGEKSIYIFEVKRVTYNHKNMGKEWKGCKKSIRYVYWDEETKKMMVKGWRLK